MTSRKKPYQTSRERKQEKERKEMEALPVEIEVENDYDNGIFERALRKELLKGIKTKKEIRPQIIMLSVKPFHVCAMQYYYDKEIPAKLHLDFSSTSRMDGQLWDALEYLTNHALFV